MRRPAASHERVYRGLLRLYPNAFRARYADEMVRLFGDQLRGARAAGTPAGAIRTWLRTLGDLAVTAVSEHARRERIMAHSLEAPSRSMRALGIAGVVGGLAVLAAFVLEKLIFEGLPALITVRILLFNLGAVGVAVGVGRRWAVAHSGGRFGSAVAWAVVLANAWYAVMVLLPVIGWAPFAGDDHLVGFLAGVALWVTSGVFGLVVAREPGFLRVAGLALALGSALALLGMGRLGLTTGSLADLFGPLALVGQGLNGLGWLLLGGDLALRGRRAAVPVTDGDRT